MFTPPSPTGSKFVVALGLVTMDPNRRHPSSPSFRRAGYGAWARPMAPLPSAAATGGYAVSVNALSHTVYRFDDSLDASRCLHCACRRSFLNDAKVLLGETGYTVSGSLGTTGSGSFGHLLAPDGVWALVTYSSVDPPPNNLSAVMLPVVRWGMGRASVGELVSSFERITADDVHAIGDQFFDLLALGAALT